MRSMYTAFSWDGVQIDDAAQCLSRPQRVPAEKEVCLS